MKIPGSEERITAGGTGVIKRVESEGRMGVAGGWGRKNGSYFLTGTEFRFHKMKAVLQMMAVMAAHPRACTPNCPC